MSCNLSLIVLLASHCSIGYTITSPYRTAQACVAVWSKKPFVSGFISMFYLKPSCSSIQSTLSTDWTFFFVSATPFLPGRQDPAVLGRLETWLPSVDSSELIKQTRLRYFSCVRCLQPIRWWLRLIHTSLFDGLHFDSILPVSVKAELNVNQGPDQGETWMQTNRTESSQVGGAGSTDWKKKEDSVVHRFLPRPWGSHTTCR